MNQTFFFYDLETSGLSPREARIMQFAGQRTDLDFNPIGDPVNLLIKMSDDTLPSPYALMVTKITPQQTLADGLTEAEFCRYLETEIFTPGTCAVGYNSVRFDDEFMRHLFWRNFRDPYEWQWKDGRSRWDLLDVVRMTRALRPEGINWPTTEKEIDGEKVQVATNRLELITKENGLKHEHAHDALSDVEALIQVTKLIHEKQPQIFDYLFKMRNKKEVQKLVNLETPRPFVYTSGRYPGEFNKTTVAFPLAPGRNGNVLVYDLRYGSDDRIWDFASGTEPGKASNSAEISVATEISDARSRKPNSRRSIFPIVKELCYNKCPAGAPLGVLEKDDGWNRIGLSRETIEKNLKELLMHPDFAEKMRTEHENRPEFPPAPDPESALYDGFLNDRDRVKVEAVRNADENSLADFHPEFDDPRLPELLLHYKAKNFPKSLSEQETVKWEEYCEKRLNRQLPEFTKAMEELSKSDSADSFILEELTLWYQSLGSADY